jgi:hypothetical protein
MQDYFPSEEIFRVLKQVHPETGITVAGMGVVMDFVKDCLHRIIECAFELLYNEDGSYGLPREVMEVLAASTPTDTNTDGDDSNSSGLAAGAAGIRSIDARTIQTGMVFFLFVRFVKHPLKILYLQ